MNDIIVLRGVKKATAQVASSKEAYWIELDVVDSQENNHQIQLWTPGSTRQEILPLLVNLIDSLRQPIGKTINGVLWEDQK